MGAVGAGRRAAPAGDAGHVEHQGLQARPIAVIAEERRDLRVWSAALDATEAQLEALHRLLSPDERARASRFAFPHLRRRFIACRGQLRQLLGGLVDREPDRIRFEYGPYGKPALADAPASMAFNVSHADDRALIVTASGCRVGVDIERIEPLPDHESLAAAVFSAEEQRELAALPAGERLAGFYAGWTRKEAFIKALGCGLTQPLTGCEVSVAPSGPARLLRHLGDTSAPHRWGLQSLSIGAGFAAAICYERASGLEPCRPQ